MPHAMLTKLVLSKHAVVTPKKQIRRKRRASSMGPRKRRRTNSITPKDISRSFNVGVRRTSKNESGDYRG